MTPELAELLGRVVPGIAGLAIAVLLWVQVRRKPPTPELPELSEEHVRQVRLQARQICCLHCPHWWEHRGACCWCLKAEEA